MQDAGAGEIAAMTVLLAASVVAARVIWLMTTQPESFVTLATADNLWSLMAGLVARLLAII